MVGPSVFHQYVPLVIQGIFLTLAAIATMLSTRGSAINRLPILLVTSQGMLMLRSKVSMLATAVVLLLPLSLRAEDQEPVAGPKTVQLEQDARIRARVAAELGDFQTALDEIETAATLSGDRTTANEAGRIADDVESQVAGGAAMADFTELINLIRTQTDGIWDDVDPDLGGSITPNTQGVYVATPALIKALKQNKDEKHLERMVQRYISANHNQNARISSQLRMVSITKLERHIAANIKAGQPLSEAVRNLAGLQRIDYLIVSPETGDIVVAGPAGNWKAGTNGQVVAVNSGRPVLQLDDFVTLSRVFAKGNYFMCTIDPKQDQVAAVQKFANENSGGMTANSARKFTRELENQLGMQNVFVKGVPQDSRVASVIVEADYRMKEIGIGKRKGVRGMKSYFNLLTRSEQRSTSSMNALRWWMAAGYDAVTQSQDGKVFQFDGDAIDCLSEDQMVRANGQRIASGQSTGSNARFAELFTKHLPELAEVDPVFADLENIFDLAMVATLVHKHGLATKVGWKPTSFADNGSFSTRKHEVPTELMTAAAHKVYPGGHVVIQVAGGVRGNFLSLLEKDDFLKHGQPLVTSDETSSLGQQNNRWWWDASK